MYDVIVIGARCGGAPTAMLLARKGWRVLLVDRATFPSDIPHGHLIHRLGPRRLQQWGLLDRVLATGCPPITGATLDFDDFPLTGSDLVVDGVPLGCAPRRLALDRVLVEAAAEAGAEVRQGVRVEAITTDGDRVTGIRGRSRETGAPATERAAVTVGADGRRSQVARATAAPVTEATPAVACWYFSYWSGVPNRGLEAYVRGRRAIFAFPTNDDLFGVFISWPIAELPTVRAAVEKEFLAVLDRVPELAERVRDGRREERFCGAADLPNFMRRPYGPGWALVGDAGCHKDPFLALGICDAFRDAELLADALDDGLSGRRDLDDALRDYERRRDAATMPEYRENLHLARFEPIPETARRLRAAVRGDQELMNRFLLAREGMIPPETFFNRENLERIMGTAAGG